MQFVQFNQNINVKKEENNIDIAQNNFATQLAEQQNFVPVHKDFPP
jgi:hypothetical protein